MVRNKNRKLHNQPVKVDGLLWASRAEADRYRQLMLLQRAGRISDLRWQVPFELIPQQTETFERISPKTGRRLKDGCRVVEQKVEYIADFVYTADGKTVVEDVKGYRDPGSAAYAKFVLKRKMMLWRHGIRVTEWPPKEKGKVKK